MGHEVMARVCSATVFKSSIARGAPGANILLGTSLRDPWALSGPVLSLHVCSAEETFGWWGHPCPCSRVLPLTSRRSGCVRESSDYTPAMLRLRSDEHIGVGKYSLAPPLHKVHVYPSHSPRHMLFFPDQTAAGSQAAEGTTR
jgi:hypothetical protein